MGLGKYSESSYKGKATACAFAMRRTGFSQSERSPDQDALGDLGSLSFIRRTLEIRNAGQDDSKSQNSY